MHSFPSLGKNGYGVPNPGVRGVLASLEFRGNSGATGTAKIELTKVGLTDGPFEEIIGVKHDSGVIIFP